MAYGVDKYPDPPDDGLDDEEREALEDAQARHIEAEIDRRRDEDLRAEGR